jgi:hypothetical protein
MKSKTVDIKNSRLQLRGYRCGVMAVNKRRWMKRITAEAMRWGDWGHSKVPESA